MTVTRKHIIRFTALILLFSTLQACNDSEEENRIPIAKVYDRILYLDEIEHLIPTDISKEDSLEMLRLKVNLWTKKQAVLRRAEIGLSEEQKDIDKIVADYRDALLIEEYKQEYLKNNVDSGIPETKIENYYNQYSESFTANEELLQAELYKIPHECKEIRLFKKILNPQTPKDSLKKREIIDTYNITNDNFDDRWITLSGISNLMPNPITHLKSILNTQKVIEMRDDNFYYLLQVKNTIFKGDKMPLEKVREQIKILLINKKKTQILKNLEKNIYLKDLKDGNIQTFID